MKRHRPRIICRAVERGAAEAKPFSPPPPPYVPPPPPTETDKLYALIYAKSVEGYRFTDNEFGIPWIERNDIEEKSGGVYVIRFRCPTDRVHDVYFGGMAEAVCKELNCAVHFIHKTKWEYGLPFEDCVWIIQKDELLHTDEPAEEDEYDSGDSIDTQEEIEGELTDDSTAEEIDERFERTLEVFV